MKAQVAPWAAALWPVARAGDALLALGSATGLASRAKEMGDAPSDEATLTTWLEEAGSWLGIEVEGVVMSYERIVDILANAAPAIVRIPADEPGQVAGVLAVVRANRKELVALGLDLRPVAVDTAEIAKLVARPKVGKYVAEANGVLNIAGVLGKARERAAEAMLVAQLRGTPIEGIHLLRRPPEAPVRALSSDYRLVPRFIAVALIFAVQQALWGASWWAIGKSVLGGNMSAGWLAMWGLLLTSSQIMRVVGQWVFGRMSIDAGALVSQRLLAGALRIDPDQMRRDGVGIALGRVLESSALHTLASTGGLQILQAAIELVLAGVALAAGATGAVHLGLLVIFVGIALFVGRQLLVARRTATRVRMEITHGLVESMVGHATRLAQGDLDELTAKDDRSLVRYLGACRLVDDVSVRLKSVWLVWNVVAVAALAPILVYGNPSATALAVSIGGVWYAGMAIYRLTEFATPPCVDALIAWDSVAELAKAAETVPDSAPPSLALAPPSPGAPALAARSVGYRHARRGAHVLSGCDLTVERGERVLLEGSSGAGKSTLAAIVAGLRKPESGLVLVGGLDRTSVGASGWRRRIAYAPQFHDNHVFAAPLAFNLLMGRAWPPSRADLVDAEAVCRDLGLGDLLDRMPGGMFQQVGELGWKLSNGERSRVFLARALLQRADVVVLDESLAALDPENLAIAIRCIEKRVPTAIVIAHP